MVLGSLVAAYSLHLLDKDFVYVEIFEEDVLEITDTVFYRQEVFVVLSDNGHKLGIDFILQSFHNFLQI